MPWGFRTAIPSSERLAQTKNTIASLVQAGMAHVILADNSGHHWVAGTDELLKPAEVYVFDHHQFQNKGISEIYLLLGVLNSIPADTPILKISGRYYLTDDFSLQIGDDDIVAKVTKQDKNLWMSTRCYLVRNVAVLEAFLRAVLYDLYGYGARIVGPRSLLRILGHSLQPRTLNYQYHDPILAIEVPAARVLKSGDFRVRLVDTLGVEGISGDFGTTLIRQ